MKHTKLGLQDLRRHLKMLASSGDATSNELMVLVNQVADLERLLDVETNGGVIITPETTYLPNKSDSSDVAGTLTDQLHELYKEFDLWSYPKTSHIAESVVRRERWRLNVKINAVWDVVHALGLYRDVEIRLLERKD